jgi:hypothetical protein
MKPLFFFKAFCPFVLAVVACWHFTRLQSTGRSPMLSVKAVITTVPKGALGKVQHIDELQSCIGALFQT